MSFELLNYLVRGVCVGFMASIPLGPIGVLCIQRTLSKSHKAGFVSGFGAATADTIFAMVAIFSLSVVMSFIESHKQLILVLGGICVLMMGVYVFLSNPVVQIRKNRAQRGNLWSDYITMFFLTLSNPTFILVFVALFATFGVGQQAGESYPVARGITLISGVLIGASAWWFSLTSIVSLVRKRFRPRHLLWINRISGVVIVLLGAATIISAFIKIADKML